VASKFEILRRVEVLQAEIGQKQQVVKSFSDEAREEAFGKRETSSSMSGGLTQVSRRSGLQNGADEIVANGSIVAYVAVSVSDSSA